MLVLVKSAFERAAERKGAERGGVPRGLYCRPHVTGYVSGRPQCACSIGHKRRGPVKVEMGDKWAIISVLFRDYFNPLAVASGPLTLLPLPPCTLPGERDLGTWAFGRVLVNHGTKSRAARRRRGKLALCCCLTLCIITDGG
jgi:hypothetical protein